MTLGELIAALSAENPNKVVPHGFARPHSYRGYYEQLAFEPAANITVRVMLAEARSALEGTFEGYKGGDYTMTEDTDCWLAQWGRCGEELGATLLGLMLAAGAVPDGAPAVEPQAPATPDQELRAAAEKLRAVIAAARADLSGNAYFGYDEANFAQGIDNACGGAAGRLAASFTPAVAEVTAGWLEQCADDYARTVRAAARFPEPVTDVDIILGWCDESDSVQRALELARAWFGAAEAVSLG